MLIFKVMLFFTEDKMETHKSYLKFLISLVLFGSNGIVASFISLKSFDIVLLRTFIGSIFIISVFLIGKNKFIFYKHKKDSLFVFISGVALGMSWIFLYESYNLSGIGMATLIYYCGPVFVILVSPFVFKEKFTNNKLIGIFLVLIGMVLINFKAFSKNGLSKGSFLAFISALFFAVMTISNKKSNTVVGFECSCLQLVSAFAVTAVYCFCKHGIYLSVKTSDILPLLFIGVINTGIGCWFYFSSMHDIPSQTLSVLGYIEPLSAVLFSAFFIHESLSSLQIAGGLLILGGSAFTALSESKPSIRFKTVKVPYLSFSHNPLK